MIVSNWENPVWISVVLGLLVGAYALIFLQNEFRVSCQTFLSEWYVMNDSGLSLIA